MLTLPRIVSLVGWVAVLAGAVLSEAGNAIAGAPLWMTGIVLQITAGLVKPFSSSRAGKGNSAPAPPAEVV